MARADRQCHRSLRGGTRLRSPGPVRGSTTSRLHMESCNAQSTCVRTIPMPSAGTKLCAKAETASRRTLAKASRGYRRRHRIKHLVIPLSINQPLASSCARAAQHLVPRWVLVSRRRALILRRPVAGGLMPAVPRLGGWPSIHVSETDTSEATENGDRWVLASWHAHSPALAYITGQNGLRAMCHHRHVRPCDGHTTHGFTGAPCPKTQRSF